MYLKCTLPAGRAYVGGVHWPLPTWDAAARVWIPGAWMPPLDGALGLARCYGYHLGDTARHGYFMMWNLAPELYEAEPGDETAECGVCASVVARTIRLLRPLPAWNERAARVFALECVEAGLRRVGRFPSDAGSIFPSDMGSIFVMARMSGDSFSGQMMLGAAHRKALAVGEDLGKDAAGSSLALALDLVTRPVPVFAVLKAVCFLSAGCAPNDDDAMRFSVAELPWWGLRGDFSYSALALLRSYVRFLETAGVSENV